MVLDYIMINDFDVTFDRNLNFFFDGKNGVLMNGLDWTGIELDCLSSSSCFSCNLNCNVTIDEEEGGRK